MDIAALKEKLEVSVNYHREGESLDLWWLRLRECAPDRLIFWRILIRTLKKILVKVYSVALDVAENFVFILSFSPCGMVKSGLVILLIAPSKIELPRYECHQGLPKCFLPLPKAELGGCARSASVTAPAI